MNYHPHNHQPKNLVYPEIPTLSVLDINHDLEFLYQNGRIPSSYDMPFGGPPPLWGQASPFPHRSGLGPPGGLPGLGRPVGVGLGPSNGILPSAPPNQAVIGLPQPNSMMQHHPLAYEQYLEISSYGGTRLRDVYTQGPGGPPLAGSRDSFLGYSGHSTRNHPSPSHGPSTPNMAATSGLGYPTTLTGKTINLEIESSSAYLREDSYRQDHHAQYADSHRQDHQYDRYS